MNTPRPRNKLQAFSSALSRRKESLHICEEHGSAHEEYILSMIQKEKNMSRKICMILSVLLIASFALECVRHAGD